jgi:tetratricopeptide (TPR) repeat protein
VRKSSRAFLLFVLAGLLYLSASAPHLAGPRGSLSSRLLGPISSVAAGWQWVRVRLAFEAGRPNLAYSRAEVALQLDPQSTSGWSYLASIIASDRGSPYRQPDPSLRTRWTKVALDLLQRGEASAHHPADLAIHAGSILVRVAEYGDEVPWPGGSLGALKDAEACFERATRLDPRSVEAWTVLAAHRALWLGSPEIATDPAARLAALEAGLVTLRRAEARIDELGPIFFQRGVLLGLFADDASGEEVDLWPTGRVGLYDAAIEAFSQAHAARFPLGEEARASAELARRDLLAR